MFYLLDYTSCLRLGLDHYNVDCNKSYEIFDPSTNNHTIVIYFNKDSSIVCPRCKSDKLFITGSKRNNIVFSTNEVFRLNLAVYRRIYKCNNCSSYHLEPNPFAANNCSISIMTEIKIMDELKNFKNTFKDVALKFNLSPTIISDIFDKRFEAKRKRLPPVLSIDEVYADKLSRTKYCCILYDPINKEIIDVLDSRRKDYLKNYFKYLPLKERLNVKYVSIDMWESYEDVAELYLPKAIICVDSFHVIKHLTECFHKIRIRVMKSYAHLKGEKDPLYWYYKKFWKYLVTDINTSDVVKIKRTKTYVYKGQVLEFMLSTSDELRLAYDLKEDYRSFNFSVGEDNVVLYDKLNDLIERFKSSNIHEYREFWKLLEHWKVEIVNSFNTYKGKRISNASIERKNRDIKTLIRIQFGLKNFIRFKNRIIYCFNDNSHILAYKKKDNNQKHRKI